MLVQHRRQLLQPRKQHVRRELAGVPSRNEEVVQLLDLPEDAIPSLQLLLDESRVRELLVAGVDPLVHLLLDVGVPDPHVHPVGDDGVDDVGHHLVGGERPIRPLGRVVGDERGDDLDAVGPEQRQIADVRVVLLGAPGLVGVVDVAVAELMTPDRVSGGARDPKLGGKQQSTG
jgi:hypothetical protein